MSEAPAPSEHQRKAFVVKLAEFRSTLPLIEQRMLDALVGAAVASRSEDAYARYWVGPQLYPAAYGGSDEGLD